MAAILILGSYAFSSCGPVGDPPEVVARQYFQAWMNSDQDKFLDAVAPEKRACPWNPLVGMAGAIAGPKAFRNVRYKTVERAADFARVRVTGQIRFIWMESDLDIVLPVIKKGGKWYVDPPC